MYRHNGSSMGQDRYIRLMNRSIDDEMNLLSQKTQLMTIIMYDDPKFWRIPEKFADNDIFKTLLSQDQSLTEDQLSAARSEANRLLENLLNL